MANLPLNPPMPSLPTELIAQIIQASWDLPLLNHERQVLFCSFCLVNKAWLALFIRIALTDVHITSSEFLDHYLYLLRERGPGDSKDDNYQLVGARSTANRICRSITFRIEGTQSRSAGPTNVSYSSAADVVTNLFEQLDILPSYLPNLRRINLEYVNCPWGFHDIFNQRRLEPFPAQATQLEIKYSGVSIPKDIIRSLPMNHLRIIMSRRSIHQLRNLSIFGAPATIIAALVEMCPNLEELEISHPYTKLQHHPLPSGLHTLKVQGIPPMEVGDTVDPWGLKAAMEGGLFSAGKSQRVVGDIRIGDTDYLKKICEQFGISLVLHSP